MNRIRRIVCRFFGHDPFYLWTLVRENGRVRMMQEDRFETCLRCKEIIE